MSIFDDDEDYVASEDLAQPTSSSVEDPSAESILQGGEFATGFDSFARPKPEWEFNFGKRLAAGAERSLGTLFGVAALGADAVGADSVRDWSVERATDLFGKVADLGLEETDLKAVVDDPKKAGKFAYELLVSAIPDLALMWTGGLGAAGIAGKMAGKPVVNKTLETLTKKIVNKNVEEITKKAAADLTKEQIYKQAIKKSAQQIGGLVGASGTEGMLGAGQSYLFDYEKRGEEASPWAAMASGGAQAMVGLLSPVNQMLGKFGGGKSNLWKMSIGEASEEISQEICIYGP